MKKSIILILFIIGCGIINPSIVNSLSIPNELINIDEYEIVSELIEVDNNLYYIGRQPKVIDYYNSGYKEVLFDLFKFNVDSQQLERVVRFSAKDLRLKEWSSEPGFATINLKIYNNKLYIYHNAKGIYSRKKIFIYDTINNNITHKNVGLNNHQLVSINDSFVYNNYLYFVVYNHKHNNYLGDYIYRTNGTKWSQKKVTKKNIFHAGKAKLIGEEQFIYYNNSKMFNLKNSINFKKNTKYEKKYLKYFHRIFTFKNSIYNFKKNKLHILTDGKKSWKKIVEKSLCGPGSYINNDTLFVARTKNKQGWMTSMDGQNFYTHELQGIFSITYSSENRFPLPINNCLDSTADPKVYGDAIGVLLKNKNKKSWEKESQIILFTLDGMEWRYLENPETTDFIVKEEKVIFPDFIKNINDFPIILLNTKKVKRY